jgi:hypothetical protein
MSEYSQTEEQQSNSPPKEMRQIMKDFLSDLFTTFPEYRDNADPLLVGVLETENSPIEPLFEHVKEVYPPRFFDILYKNDEIFEDAEKNTEFLPGIQFADIWKMDDVTDSIKETIWRYLQLIMFSVLETIQSQDTFGDTAKLFEAIDETELKSKIEETVEQMKGLFDNQEAGLNSEGINLEDLPNADSVHEHLNGLMDGKLGKLAAEIAEETAQDFEMDMNAEGDVGDMFKKLFRNPGKLMGLVNTISKKLDTKMKSGDISESDLMKEAGDLMSRMKNMPGMPNIEELMKNMNVPRNKQGMMKQQFNQNMRTNGAKARLQRKLEERRQAAEQMQAATSAQPVVQQTTDPNIQFDGKSFTNGSKVKRSKAKQGKKGKKK